MWILGLKGLKETRKLHGLVFFLIKLKRGCITAVECDILFLSVKGVSFVCRRCTKRAPFLSWWYIKG